MMHCKPIQRFDDRVIPSLVRHLSTGTSPGPSAKMQCELCIDSINHFIDHINSEVCRTIRVIVQRSYLWIDEQAQVRIVNLDDIGSCLANEFDFFSQKTANS